MKIARYLSEVVASRSRLTSEPRKISGDRRRTLAGRIFLSRRDRRAKSRRRRTMARVTPSTRAGLVLSPAGRFHFEAATEEAAETSDPKVVARIAAAFAVVCLSLWSLRSPHHFAETAVGAFQRVDLPDGSVAQLNTDSSIDADMSGAERRLRS